MYACLWMLIVCELLSCINDRAMIVERVDKLGADALVKQAHHSLQVTPSITARTSSGSSNGSGGRSSADGGGTIKYSKSYTYYEYYETQ